MRPSAPPAGDFYFLTHSGEYLTQFPVLRHASRSTGALTNNNLINNLRYKLAREAYSGRGTCSDKCSAVHFDLTR